MLFHFSAVLVFMVVSAAFIFGNLLIGSLVRPKMPTAEKLMIYECGEPTIGSSWVRYNIRFYTIALVYLIFDVEVVFLFPAALMFKSMKMIALVEVMTFVLILAIGLIYAWRYGNLDWIHGGMIEAEEAPDEIEAKVSEG